MSPRSRKRKRRSAKRTAQPPKLVKRPYGFEWVPSQFEGMTVEEIDKKLRDIGQEHQQKYEQSFQKLQEEIIKWDPLYLLSASAFYSTFDSYPGMQGTSHRVRILQHHLELLQGLVLRNKKELYSTNFPPPQVIGSIRVLLDESSKSFPLRRFATLDSSLSEEERHRLFLLDEIRGHTQAVRNWGYPQQVKRIVTDLFAPLDDSVEKVLGVRVRNLIEMWFDISKLVVGRVQSHINKFAPIQGAKSVKEAVKIFYAVKPETASSPEDMITFLKQQGLNLQQTRYFLLSYSDRWLSEIFSIALSDFVSSYPSHVDEVDLRKILNIWAFSFGDLAKENPEHFFLGNPVWRAPLIELENDRYFLPIPGLFLSFALELFEDLIRGIPDLLARYERRRAKFLEDEIERLFMSVFPSAKVYRGSLWDDPNTQKQFENDVLALIDSYQIIVEAKSGRVSAPALRGAAGRLENEIKDLIIDPSLQAKRFAQYLEDNRGKHRFQTLRGVLNEVDNTDCRETIRLNVTLDILANVQARWGDLRRAGFIPEDVDIGITLSLADLDLVFDLLDTASERIHYLARRFEFEHNAHYIADETDLIAFYIDNGFNIGEAEYNGTAIVIYGMSEILAPYYMSI